MIWKWELFWWFSFMSKCCFHRCPHPNKYQMLVKNLFSAGRGSFMSRSTEWLLFFLFGFCEEQSATGGQDCQKLIPGQWNIQYYMTFKSHHVGRAYCSHPHCYGQSPFSISSTLEIFFSVHFCLFKCSKPPIFLHFLDRWPLVIMWVMSGADEVRHFSLLVRRLAHTTSHQ